jgi:MFS family permease
MSPLAKSVSDAFGPAPPLLAGTFLQIIATAFMGWSPHFAEIIVFRCAQGLAAGMYVPAVLHILSATHTTRQRSALMNFAMQSIGVGTLVGLLWGGAIYTSVSKGDFTTTPTTTFSSIAALFGVCLVFETYLILILNVVPWCRHITPPDAETVGIDTMKLAHEAGALLPCDWAGQRRGPTSERMQISRNGVYRRYDPEEVAQFDAMVESDQHFLKASASTTLLGSVEEGRERSGTFSKYKAERQASRHASRNSSYASLSANPLDVNAPAADTGSGMFKSFNEIDNSLPAGDEVKDGEARGESTLVASWFLVMISALVIGAVEPVVPFYLYKTFQTTPINQAFVLLCMYVTYLWASANVLRVSKLVGYPSVLLTGLCFMGVGLLLVRVDTQISLAAVGLVLVGLGAALVDSPATMYMNEEAAKCKKDAYDVFFIQNTATVVGLTIGPLACSFMSASISYVAFFEVAAACVGILIPIFSIIVYCSKRPTSE